ncbi:MAG TPA: betaine/proline/choline family ABC transporter ATP-binding protein [Firmicutes bacterium]|jgi:osmoprotectant transport system ATP-binding protein|nr:betaine/proline/choline family ABC transporter ATP-binding protein [Bacillota bacterium]
MIEFRHVNKIYDDKVKVVDDISLDIKQGEFVVLIGPSGCGKSTVLEMMTGIEKPTRGSIYLNGKDIRRLNETELRRNVGHVTQQTSLSPNLTIGRNIGQALRSSGSKGQTEERINSRTKELLKMVGMDPLKYMDRFPSELSGGQQQRIGIVRELAREPNILLMDEPFSALDPVTRRNLQDDLKKLHGMMKSTIVLVTHDIDEAFKLGDRIVLMRRGKIVQSGSPEDFLKDPATKFVKEFIGRDRPAKNAETLTVEKVAVRRAITASPDLGLARAVRRMRKMRVSTLVVVKDDETLVGIITARDVRKHRNRPGKIADIVQGDIPVVYEGSSAKTAFEALFLGNAGILPVVDDSNRLKGLVTKTSLAQQLYQAVWN